MTSNIHSDEYTNLDIQSWDDLNLDPTLLRGVFSCGYESPSPIQKKAIYPLMKGRDIIAQAQSGTGKTATFSIGGLTHIDTSLNEIQMVVLSPTRELTSQIATVIQSIGSSMPNLRVNTLIGGSPVSVDIKQIQDNMPQIIVGCPGRVYDLCGRRQLQLSSVKIFILDEADEMLSHGFKRQIYEIYQYLPSIVQVALFSATLPPYIYDTASKFMKEPVNITVKAEQLTLEGIAQYYIALDNNEQKYDTLVDLYNLMPVSQCIIYTNHINTVDNLYTHLKQQDFPVCKIHSSMEKEDREKSILEFKQGTYRLLISSDITARGIDIQQVSVVINYDLPMNVHTYLHRIGRGGRWGRKGMGINMVTRRDINMLKEIEQFYSTQINELPEQFNTV